MANLKVLLPAAVAAASCFALDRSTAQDLVPEEPATFQRFGSAAAYGGPDQQAIGCSLTNVGTAAIRIKNLAGFDQNGAKLRILAAGCPVQQQVFTLAPGQTCQLNLEVLKNQASGCRGLVNRKSSLRGRALVFGPAGVTTQPIE